MPIEDIEFLETYANQHRTAVSQVVAGLVKGLHRRPYHPIHPDVQRLTGLLAAELDAKESYVQHILEKHR